MATCTVREPDISIGFTGAAIGSAIMALSRMSNYVLAINGRDVVLATAGKEGLWVRDWIWDRDPEQDDGTEPELVPWAEVESILVY